MWEHITAEGVATTLAALIAVLGGNAWVTSALIDRKLVALNGVYVRSNECVLRTAGTDRSILETREEARAACLAAASRDTALQQQIMEVKIELARRAADAILRDENISKGIAALLARK